MKSTAYSLRGARDEPTGGREAAQHPPALEPEPTRHRRGADSEMETGEEPREGGPDTVCRLVRSFVSDESA